MQIILERIQDLDIDDMRGYSAATLEPVMQYEEKDSLEEQFKRRMGMRAYFKQLTMSLVRIRNSKLARTKSSKKKANQEESKVTEERTDGYLNDTEERPMTAATNPPMKKGKGGGKGKKGKKAAPKKKKWATARSLIQ